MLGRRAAADRDHAGEKARLEPDRPGEDCAAGESSGIDPFLVDRQALHDVRDHRLDGAGIGLARPVAHGVVGARQDPPEFVGGAAKELRRLLAARARVEEDEDGPLASGSVGLRQVELPGLGRIGERRNRGGPRTGRQRPEVGGKKRRSGPRGRREPPGQRPHPLRSLRDRGARRRSRAMHRLPGRTVLPSAVDSRSQCLLRGPASGFCPARQVRTRGCRTRRRSRRRRCVRDRHRSPEPSPLCGRRGGSGSRSRACRRRTRAACSHRRQDRATVPPAPPRAPSRPARRGASGARRLSARAGRP